MPRSPGSRNADYEVKKTQLALAVVPRLLAEDGPTVSMRQLAVAAGVSVPTLSHYFGDRSGVIRAAWLAMWKVGEPGIEAIAENREGDPTSALRLLIDGFLMAWQAANVGTLVANGLATGLHDTVLGPAYVDHILEPSLQVAERQIAIRMELGQLAPSDPRYAAIALLSPVILALLHQGPLRGDQCRPLDIEAFLASHLASFVRAHGLEHDSPG